MVLRSQYVRAVCQRLEQFPVVAVIGARQAGKTTLARLVSDEFGEAVTHFDLEKPSDIARLTDPQLALEPLQGLVILDEVQRLPKEKE